MSDLFYKLILFLRAERLMYIVIYKLSIFIFLFRIKKFFHKKSILESIVNQNLSFKSFLPSVVSNIISYKLGIKLFSKNYINQNIVFNGNLKRGTILISAHIGQSHFFYKLFQALNYKCLYIRSASFKGFDLKSNGSLYNDEYIFKDKKQIIDVAKKIYNGESIYVAFDGSRATDKMYFNDNYYIYYSSIVPCIGIKKNMNLAFISLNIIKNGKFVFDISYYVKDKDSSLNEWLKEKYLSTIINYPYSFNVYRIHKD